MNKTLSTILKELSNSETNNHTMYIDRKNESWEIKIRRLK